MIEVEQCCVVLVLLLESSLPYVITLGANGRQVLTLKVPVFHLGNMAPQRHTSRMLLDLVSALVSSGKSQDKLREPLNS